MNDLSGAGTPAVLHPVHARRVWRERAICGDPGPNQWTDQRQYVSCPLCVAEIERRLVARKAHA